ncbi:L-rhamnose mutarotase [Halegenticoccus tardaugens]|uniref:L-rhamnose mutarotase n=1 Tax=Halegenticoccus tardaugens TaxID=2071624 RepID=UPI00100C07D5|nr:L-rhamnose mutarotase [Halegenticoccus tardaugens]
MARIAFHLTIKDEQQDAYREAHQHVSDELERAYLDSDAGLQTYSVFEKEGHVFGFMEVDKPNVIQDIMENSDAQAQWDEVMEPILTDEDVIWLDEVYRMI